MTENNDRIDQLLEKLELLLKRQDSIGAEINELRTEIIRLKLGKVKEHETIENTSDYVTPITDSKNSTLNIPPIPKSFQEQVTTERPISTVDTVKTNMIAKASSFGIMS